VPGRVGRWVKGQGLAGICLTGPKHICFLGISTVTSRKDAARKGLPVLVASTTKRLSIRLRRLAQVLGGGAAWSLCV